jgi:acetyl esterase/lipase
MPSTSFRSTQSSACPRVVRRALAAAVLCVIGSTNVLAAPPATLPGGVTVISNLRYRDGSKDCTLDLALPKGRADRPRPAVVVIHGGGWIEGDKSSFVSPRTPGNILDFAAAGFVAAAVNYRMSREAPFPAGLYDCQAAVRWLRAHAPDYRLDPNRIGAYGNSAGGHLALLLGLLDPSSSGLEEPDGPFPRESSRVQAVASDSGPLDLVVEHKHGTLISVIERFMGGPPDAKRLAVYKRASPINHLDGKTPPLLLIYGEADNQIDVRTADRFVSDLSHSGHKEISYFRLADAGHCPHSLIRVPYLRPVVIEFFQRTLGK